MKLIKDIINNQFTKQLHWTTVVSEKGMLAVIGCLTLVAAGLDIWDMFLARDINLADLFLLFIYVEIIGMVGAYYSTHVIPVTFPIVIAITAMCRLLILQGKESEPWVLISSAGAIFILAAAVYVLNIKKLKKDNEDV